MVRPGAAKRLDKPFYSPKYYYILLASAGDSERQDRFTYRWANEERLDGMSEPGKPTDNDKPTTGLALKSRPKTKKPSMYKVLMLNDDYTPMEFVVYVLERFFNMNAEQATQVMLQVHQRGIGVCGVFTYEIAETKVAQVTTYARQHQHPLLCTMEEA